MSLCFPGDSDSLCTGSGRPQSLCPPVPAQAQLCLAQRAPLGQPAEVQSGQHCLLSQVEGVETRKRGVRVAGAQLSPSHEANEAAARGEGAAPHRKLHVGLWICRPQPGMMLPGPQAASQQMGQWEDLNVTQANDLPSVPQLLPVQNGD